MKEKRLGEENYNKIGSKMKIVEYIDCNNIKIEFDNGYSTISQIDNLKAFIAIRIFDGYTECCKSKNGFAKKYNLHHECICKCLLGKQKRHKGWEFRYE